MPILGLGWAIPVKSHVWKFGLDWFKWEVCKISGGGRSSLLGGSHMWAAMPIFVCGQAISVKSLVWKFGSDWLSLSRVIVVTEKKKKKSREQKSPITVGGGGVYISHLMPIFELGWAIPVKSHVWKFGLDWLKSEVCKISGERQKPPIRGVTLWPAMPIFVHGQAISVKSLVWKFGSHWLSLSRVIVITDKKKKKITDGTENNKNFSGR